MENLFDIATGDNHFEKNAPTTTTTTKQTPKHNPTQKQTPKNNDQRTCACKTPTTTTKQKHRKHDQVADRRRQLVFAAKETYALGYFCCFRFEAFARAV